VKDRLLLPAGSLQGWYLRQGNFRAALASLADAIHAEPLSAWFGQGGECRLMVWPSI
jgi:hypothetical protein